MSAFSNTVFQIHEAALCSDLWPLTLDGIAAMLNSDGALVITLDDAAWLDVVYSSGLSTAVRMYREGEWWRVNPWRQRVIEAAFRAGDVYCDQDVVSERELREHPYYADFLARAGLGRQMVAVMAGASGALMGLVVQRAKEKGSYSAAEIESLRLLARHMEQALRISALVIRQQSSQAALLQALDLMDRAVFIMDKEKRLLVLNRPAEEIMGLFFSQAFGRLEPIHRDERDAFAVAVDSARNATRPARELPQPIMLSDLGRERQVAVWVIPVVAPPQDRPAFIEPGACLVALAHPLSHHQTIDPTVIRNLFGLTMGEARLAALLGAGHTIKVAAGELGITEGTSRVVLKRVFRKMGVRRQAELVSKLGILGKVKR